MNNRWLSFIIIGFLSVSTFLFYASFVKTTPKNSSEQNTALSTLVEPTVTFVNPSRGAKEPRVTLIEFSDFACEHCATMQTALQAALRAYPNDVRHVWKNLPNPSAHEQAVDASVAAHCADRQERFWDYHDALFVRQSFLSEETFKQIANELKLDSDRFSLCMQSQDTNPIVEKDIEEARALGLIATPTLFIGKQKIVGAVSVEDLMNAIEQELSSP